MAKVKAKESPLELLKKHYFWLVVPVVAVIAFFVAFTANGNIKKKYTEKKQTVETAKKNTDQIATNATHPNEKTIDAIKAESNVLKKSVFEAWGLMYDDQKLRNRWPRQLSKEFLGIVENLKFRAPIAPSSTKQHLLEDYAFFIGNHLPELLKRVSRRRCQVQEYRWIQEENRFFPVYIDNETNQLYVIITQGESSQVKEVRLYDLKRDLLLPVEDSAQRATLLSKEKEPFFREVDPWITDPKDYISYGGPSGAGMMGGSDMGGMSSMGGSMGSMGGSSSGGPPGGGSMMGGGASSGGGMGGPPGGSMGGGSRGSMGGMGGMAGGSMGSDQALPIPGDGIDPAQEQVSPGSGGGSRNSGMGAMAGAGRGSGSPGGSPAGGMPGGMPGGAAMGGGSANSQIGGNSVSYPGLPPYSERRRVVGNVDWGSPEVYTIPSWSATGAPLSIEIWYAQESLWVYEALLRVIEQTNNEAGDNVTIAPIKRIEELLIGQPAAAAWRTIEKPIGNLTGGGAMMGGMGMMGGSMGGMGSMGGSMGGAMGGMGGSSSMGGGSGGSSGGSMGGMGGGSMGGMGASMGSMGGSMGGGMGGAMRGMGSVGSEEKQALMKILLGRYLDSENKPLSAEKAPPFAEFNKMPICLRLIVDQRRIPDILVNCANCSMPIDIKHIRICPDNAEPFSMPGAGGGGGGSMGGMMGGSMGGMGGAGGSMGGSSSMSGPPGGGMGGSGSSGMGGSGGSGMGGSSGGMGRSSSGGSGARGSMGGGIEMGSGASGSGGIDVGRSEISQTSGYGVDAIRVEVYGIINIFNEPKAEDFGTGGAAEAGAVDITVTEETLNNTPTVTEAIATETDATDGTLIGGTVENIADESDVDTSSATAPATESETTDLEESTAIPAN